MKVKSLLSKMGRKKIEKVCKEKGWRLPTLEEANKYIDDIEHDTFWIDGYGDSLNVDTGIIEQRPLYYSNGEAHSLNPSFMLNLVVIKPEKICPHCGQSCDKN